MTGVSIPGCEIIEGGPDKDPDSGVPAILVRVIDDGTYAFYYTRTNGFGNYAKAKQIAEQIQGDKNS